MPRRGPGFQNNDDSVRLDSDIDQGEGTASNGDISKVLLRTRTPCVFGRQRGLDKGGTCCCRIRLRALIDMDRAPVRVMEAMFALGMFAVVRHHVPQGKPEARPGC